MADVKATGGSSVGGSNLFRTLFPVFIIVLCYLVASYVFYNVFGAASNFEGDDPIKGHPKNIYGTIFKGGFVIPIGLTLLLTMLVFCIERAFTIGRAWGIKTPIIFLLLVLIIAGVYSLFGISNYFLLLVIIAAICGVMFFILKNDSLDAFVSKLRTLLSNGDVEGAMRECDAKQNSVGNVVKSGLVKYKEMAENTHLDKEEKKELIKSEIEKATMLELPGLDRNLSILATVASLGTLVGLIGTVLGMIRSFQALGAGGAPNAAELSVGISEALVNTAIGITTSALAIFFYNLFTTKIDSITYKMEEVGYSIIQAFDKRK
ncbi:MAG: MotA/TolQ/ExbB proton channel family protein [Bacteroidia bacterium]|nr:MotA/TolQ/ExbB proton channel family protein [Bacteroidia bacterium]